MFVYELSGCGFESNCSHLSVIAFSNLTAPPNKFNISYRINFPQMFYKVAVLNNFAAGSPAFRHFFIILFWGHSLITYAKFSEKLIFLTLLIGTYTCPVR